MSGFGNDNYTDYASSANHQDEADSTASTDIAGPRGQKQSNQSPDSPTPISETCPESPRPTQTQSSGSENESPRERIPGGAAAKLMLLGPTFTDEDEEANIEPSQEGSQAHADENINDIPLTLKKAKAEFEKGRENNRRYQQGIPEGDEKNFEKRSTALSDVGSPTPSFMDRNAIFHDTPEAAVQALLNPREKNMGIAASSSGLKKTASSQSGSVSAFRSPTAEARYGGGFGNQEKFRSLARQDVSDVLLKPLTERKLKTMKMKMHDPSKKTGELLTAIASPEDKSKLTLGYMVRRKNACGALQTLTNVKKNRVRLCWTIGVLQALTSVLTDCGSEDLETVYPDKRIRSEYEAARERTISALMNLSMPVENRVPFFHTQGLAQVLIGLINRKDAGFVRRGCSWILVYLAKSAENRLLMMQVPGFVDALISVLEPLELVQTKPEPPESPKKLGNWSSDGSESSESSGSEDEEDDDEGPIDSVGSAGTSIKSHTDDESEKSPKRSKSPIDADSYEESADEFLRSARQSVFAIATHLVKEKDNAYHFARNNSFVSTLVAIAKYEEKPSHLLVIKILANLTRHRLNTKILVFRERIVVPALVQATLSEDDEVRQFACYALQNLSQDKSCRQELAIVENLITALCDCSRQTSAEEERLAAISALKNLCDEPANLIPMTNTPECIATLMHLAHGKEAGVTDVMQYRACDALATLSHWLRKIATSGQSLDSPTPRNRALTKGLFVPSLRVVTYNQWQ